MRIFSVFFVFLICSSVSVFSQNSSKPEKIKKLMDLSGSGNLGVQATTNMIAVYKKNYPNVDSTFWNEFEKEITADELLNLIIPIYDKYFSEQEIDDLIKFYSSPTGKKIILALPAVIKESMSVGEQWGRQLAEKVLQRMKEKGYSKSS